MDFTDELYLLKAAFRRLVKAAGGVEAAEAVAGVSKASISKWQSVDHTCTAPLHVVLLLERDVGSPIVTRELARLTGYAVSPGHEQTAQERSLQGILLGSLKELGEAADAIGQRNHFDCIGEFHAVEKECVDVLHIAQVLVDEVRRRRPGFRQPLRAVGAAQ